MDVSYCLSIPQLKDVWVFSSFVVMNKATTNTRVKFLCEPKFSFHLGKYLEVGLLGQMVSVNLPLWETAKMASKVAVQFLIHTICIWELWLGYILQELGIVKKILILAILGGV